MGEKLRTSEEWMEVISEEYDCEYASITFHFHEGSKLCDIIRKTGLVDI